MIQVLNDPRFGNSLTQVDATVKKHEAISADIMAREERFHDLNAMSEELVKENYHGAQRVKKREEEVLQRWKDLLKLLESRKINLNNINTMFTMLREIETVMSTIQVIYFITLQKDAISKLIKILLPRRKSKLLTSPKTSGRIYSS